MLDNPYRSPCDGGNGKNLPPGGNNRPPASAPYGRGLRGGPIGVGTGLAVAPAGGTSVSEEMTVGTLHRALTRAARATALTTTNLAQNDTPGYRAQELAPTQQGEPRLRLAQPERGHLVADIDGGETPHVREVNTGRARPDGNNVDVDVEMTRLAALQGRFTAMTQLLRKQFALLRYAATDGRS